MEKANPMRADSNNGNIRQLWWRVAFGRTKTENCLKKRRSFAEKHNIVYPAKEDQTRTYSESCTVTNLMVRDETQTRERLSRAAWLRESSILLQLPLFRFAR